MIVSNFTVNRWLPGSIDLFTDEFFKEPMDLPPGRHVSNKDIPLWADLSTGAQP